MRAQIESSSGGRFAGALTPVPRQVRETMPTGVESLDAMLGGGLPIGAITELAGPLSSGRTGVAMSTIAQAMREGSMCAWVDASDAFDPESAAANGVRLDQLLWVRCGLQGTGSGPVPGAAGVPGQGIAAQSKRAASQTQARAGQHPRNEVHGLDKAVGELLRSEDESSARRRDRSIGTPGAPNRVLTQEVLTQEVQSYEMGPRCCPPEHDAGRRAHKATRTAALQAAHTTTHPRSFAPVPRDEQVSSDRQPKRERSQQTSESRPASAFHPASTGSFPLPARSPGHTGKPWARLDQALRAADLLLQAGGFRVLVLDLGSIAPEHALRIPLATWFRFRAAADQGRSVLLAITQTSCAKSSAGLVVCFASLEAQDKDSGSTSYQSGLDNKKPTILESIRYHAHPLRQRFTPQPVTAIDHPHARRPPQATWQQSAYPAREQAREQAGLA